MYDNGVSIAPTRRLGQPRTSINDQGHLPLGSKIANVSQKFNDDTEITTTRTVHVQDPVARNENYIDDQRLTPESRDLVGKKAPNMPTTEFDQSIMNTFNAKTNENMTLNEVKERKLSCYNLVSFPFTQAKPFELPSCQS